MARLVDTSVFIELERQRKPLSALDSVSEGEPIALASITASELLIGVLRSVSDDRRRCRAVHVENILSRVPVIWFDLAAAEVHAALSVQLASIGQSIGPNDLIIAATALARGYELLTHNLRHFARVPGLIVREPVW